MYIILLLNILLNLVLLVAFIFLYNKINILQYKLQSIEKYIFSLENLNNDMKEITQSNQKHNINVYNKNISSNDNIKSEDINLEDKDITDILLSTIDKETPENYKKNPFELNEINDETINNLLKHSKLKVEKEKLKNLLKKGDLENTAKILKLTLSEVKLILYNQR